MSPLPRPFRRRGFGRLLRIHRHQLVECIAKFVGVDVLSIVVVDVCRLEVMALLSRDPPCGSAAEPVLTPEPLGWSFM